MSYPNVNFVDTDTEKVASEMISDYEQQTGRTLSEADPVRILLLWFADVIAHFRVQVNETAKMNVLRYAKGEYLDSLAELFRDTERLPAKAATTVIKFMLTAAQSTITYIPAGTRVGTSNGIVFETSEIFAVSAGETTAEVPAICQTAGIVGNGISEGKICNLLDAVAYIGSAANTTVTGGGSEEETDEAYYERCRESLTGFSTAGPINAYIYHAKSVSADISDVSVKSPSAGKVDIRVLCGGGEIPGSELLMAVTNAVTADNIRPLTDNVTVSAPETQAYNINITYYVSSEQVGQAAEISNAVSSAVDSYIVWQSEKMGRDINPSKLIAMVMDAGAKRVTVTSPVYTAVDEQTVAKLGTKTVVNGGTEDE